MGGVGSDEDWLGSGGGDQAVDPPRHEDTGYAIPGTPEVGVDGLEWHLAEASRLLSERSTRQGGRTVLAVPIDQRTLDQARAAFGDELETRIALGIARELGAWKHAQDRKQGLIVDGKKVG